MPLIRLLMNDTTEYLGIRLESVTGTSTVRIHENANVYTDVEVSDVNTVAVFKTRSDLEVARGNPPVEDGGDV